MLNLLYVTNGMAHSVRFYDYDFIDFEDMMDSAINHILNTNFNYAEIRDPDHNLVYQAVRHERWADVLAKKLNGEI